MQAQNAGHDERSAGAAGDPIDDIWIPARQAALVLARPERWLREECRAGHLPCHGEPRTGQVFLVPMTATEELAQQPPTHPRPQRRGRRRQQASTDDARGNATS